MVMCNLHGWPGDMGLCGTILFLGPLPLTKHLPTERGSPGMERCVTETSSLCD